MNQVVEAQSVNTVGPVYLDCNATTPIEPEVLEAMNRIWTEELGNFGSRTHKFGLTAKIAVRKAREQVASVVCSQPEDVYFTSGATESNNIAILGLAEHAFKEGKRHIVSTAIEHKAVLEPLHELEKRGFSVSLVRPDSSGLVTADAVRDSLRANTALVSIMHANNETGVIQPIAEIAGALGNHPAYFHVDAAQGFGKELEMLRNGRIDMIAVSSHKIFGPVGVGGLIVRRRNFRKVPLKPLAFGGGQEAGMRHGTLPVPLIAGMGLAAEIALRDHSVRLLRCINIRNALLEALLPLGIRINGASERIMPHVLNFSVDGVDSEALMVGLKDLIAISNGSACTSQSYEPSHVLTAMGLSDLEVAGAVRASWCHMTNDVDWPAVALRISSLT